MSNASQRAPRISAAILLVDGDGDSLRVLLVERAAELRFFGGYHAFVGGVREPVDGPDDDDGSDRSALRRCAVRELFEETGVLLDPWLAALPHGELAAMRSELQDRAGGTDRWQRALARRERELRAADEGMADTAFESATLREVCRITTPPFAPVRYDTVFALADLPRGQSVRIETGELTGASWWRPHDALAAWRRGEIAIVPPALILLELLASGDREQFARDAAAIAASYVAGALHEVRFSPGIVLAPLATATLPPATTTNCLIVGTDTLWIVDPASPDPTEHARLFALLDHYVARGARVAGVLATHHHPDHVGGIAVTCARYGVSVRGHAITLDRLPSDCPRGEPLADGDTIALGKAPDGTPGWTLEALFTPGHDRGHLCFRESRYGAVVAGDMISTVSTILIDPPEGHLRTYLASLAKLAERCPSTLYPAHGPAARDGGKVIERFVQHRAEREAKLLVALDLEAPRDVPALVPVVYSDTPSDLHAIAARSLTAGLEKLREDGLAILTNQGWLRVETR